MSRNKLNRRQLSKFQRKHGERIAARRAVNGQPNGYQPISEAELQREKETKRLMTNLGRFSATEIEDMIGRSLERSIVREVAKSFPVSHHDEAVAAVEREIESEINSVLVGGGLR